MSTARFGFEVFGKVQGVFFRKHTKKCADALGLAGWVRNTDRGTVVGEAEGPAAAMAEFRVFLESRGSPRSRIDRAEFSLPDEIRDTGGEFVIVR
jgi:acylphosphatase